jgi:sugar phosphate isomerase/epimerase
MAKPYATRPWRLGTTSYVIDADLVGNAAHLAQHGGGTRAGCITDMQLVLFDLPDGPSNLPDATTIAELARIGRRAGLTYTVHLLDDLAPLEMATDATTDTTTGLSRNADLIARTRALDPHAYVLHLDGRGLRAGTLDATTWATGLRAALRQLVQLVDEPRRLAVENLEGYAPDLVMPFAEQMGISRCVDVGHLWRDGIDPLPYLAQAAHCTTVVHLHGVARPGSGDKAVDHCALSHTPPAQLDALLRQLAAQRYTGVLTLELFGPDDLAVSLDALEAALARIAATPSTHERG